MLRFGIVTNVDPNTCRVRVKFADQEDLISPWLPVLQQKTFLDKFYSLPDLNEQVACLMDDRLEAGVVLGAIYSEADAVPVSSKDKLHVKFADGTIIEYDKANHKLTADIKGSADIKTTGNITITGDVIVNGNITASGDVADQGGAKTMSGMRAVYNGHSHSAPGGVTGPPGESM